MVARVQALRYCLAVVSWSLNRAEPHAESLASLCPPQRMTADLARAIDQGARRAGAELASVARHPDASRNAVSRTASVAIRGPPSRTSDPGTGFQ